MGKDSFTGKIRKSFDKDRSDTFSTLNHRNYFEGYSSKIVTSKSGRQKTILVYTEDYYQQNIPRKKRVMIRILFCALYLFALALFIFVAIQNTPSNYAYYVEIPVMVSLLAFLWMFLVLVRYMPVEKLKIFQFNKGAKRIKLVSIASTACLGCAMASNLAFFFLNPQEGNLSVLLNAGLSLLAGASFLTMYLVEAKIEYIRIPNEEN